MMISPARPAGGPCFECGAPSLHDHHVIPRSLGGARTVPLCEDCHGKIHGRDMRTSALTIAALQSVRADGRRTGEVPYGFTADAEGRLVANEDERNTLALVRRCRDAGMPLRAIVAELARAGIVSRSGRAYGLTQVANLAKATMPAPEARGP